LTALVEYESDDAPRWFASLQHGLPAVPAEELNAVGRQLFEFLLTNGQDPRATQTDPGSDFINLGDGLWYPFMLTSGVNKNFNGFDFPYLTPARNSSQANDMFDVRPDEGFENLIKDLNNVDIVMTNDPEKWSRCIVLETASRFMPGYEGEMLTIKEEPSIGKDGLPDGTGFGRSWFPGYAIDVETGKRLNIFFGENSAFDQAYSDARTSPDDVQSFTRGSDMLYNPSDEFFSNPDITTLGFDEIIQNLYLGGQHFIYVTREEYDSGNAYLETYTEAKAFAESINNPAVLVLTEIELLKSITWTSMSFLAAGTESLSYSDGIVPSDVTFKLRVEKLM